MDSDRSGVLTEVSVQEPKANPKGKAVAGAAPPPPVVISSKVTTTSNPKGGWRRGFAIFDLVLRLCGIAVALAATAIMGTTQQTLPFFTQFFVIANAIASGYLVLSLPFSIICIVRPHLRGLRIVLIVLDTLMVGLAMAAAASAATIADLAQNGNSNANWAPICQQFDDFCQSITEAVQSSFAVAVIFILLVVFSSLSLRRN
ncbi:casparian strip membrane protein 3 [Quercus suber]|uniref:CASP-like protein n=1 Tax=Quercus suber TaxID=58331 RepID=A0AAW0LP01_QUESU